MNDIKNELWLSKTVDVALHDASTLFVLNGQMSFGSNSDSNNDNDADDALPMAIASQEQTLESAFLFLLPTMGKFDRCLVRVGLVLVGIGS